MCYDGTLVMPSSYAVMDEEEMTYVGGGFKVTITKALVVYAAVKIVGSVAKHYGRQAMTNLLKTYGKTAFRYILSCTNPILSAISAILAGFVVAASIAAVTIASYVWVSGKSVTIGW